MNSQEQQQYDSDRIYKAMKASNYPTFKEIEQAIMIFYYPDLSFSRVGICHALKRLELEYRNDA